MKKRLKIAQIAPIWFDVPPKQYGGTERIVSYITEELVKRGHNVSLFATQGSETKAKLVSPMPDSLLSSIKSYLDYNFNAINYYTNAFVFQHAQDFDVIHSHAFYLSFPFCDFVNTPTIHTLHNQLPRGSEPENELMRKYHHLNYVSISNEFQTHFDGLNYVGTVYHGLDLKYFPFNPTGGDYLLWIGRASKNKGEDDAIVTAKRAGKKLLIGASVRPDTEKYFHEKIEPNLNEKIELIQNMSFEKTHEFYGNSKAFIFPVKWREPFGLIMIESMACGSPVIAYARGSTPEIIKDGVTGFLINPSEDERKGDFQIKKTGIDGLCEAVERIFSMSDKEYKNMRLACRRHVEEKFTVEKMVDNYEKIYYKLLGL
ncbi:glycosyltransferase family 4 protein [Patescibacteria group bacterium]|nr:glycosyltransferase family 4 protein [Patescibacteria group bacterium]